MELKRPWSRSGSTREWGSFNWASYRPACKHDRGNGRPGAKLRQAQLEIPRDEFDLARILYVVDTLPESTWQDSLLDAFLLVVERLYRDAQRHARFCRQYSVRSQWRLIGCLGDAVCTANFAER
jgi:hypothetical protein